MLVELISGALVTTGASLLLTLVIGYVLTRAEEKEDAEDEFDSDC